MQLVMGVIIIWWAISRLLWDCFTAGVIKIKLGISAATLRRTEQGDTYVSKHFPPITQKHIE